MPLALVSLLSSITIDMPSRSDSSRTSEMPATSLLRRIASILDTKFDFTTS